MRLSRYTRAWSSRHLHSHLPARQGDEQQRGEPKPQQRTHPRWTPQNHPRGCST
uniref:Uncharacterized protein n=1 Tax=uncultured marine virus TaxID=186617 RepID=A0A0F7L6T0_9VIRU|nr:hypothetical protein [uncultured marine virus]